MTRALVIFVRCFEPGQAEVDLDKLGSLLRPEAEFQRFSGVYLVGIGGSTTRKRLEALAKRSLLDEGRADRLAVFHPTALRDLKDEPGMMGPLEAYVRCTLVGRIASRSPLSFQWRDDWPLPSLAIAGLVSCSDALSWWAATACKPLAAALPRVPRGFRVRDLLRPLPSAHLRETLVGDSAVMGQLRAHLSAAAKLTVPVMLVGETGTGKELAAKALHNYSGREGRFVPVNAALLSHELARSDLFGHRKGSFSGATEDRAGRIAEAEGGTFFLDELLEMPDSVQAQLLRATATVEEGLLRIVSVGATDSQTVEVRARMVAAVQRPPKPDDVRQDLYERLAWIRISIPPLRDRGSDAALLAVREVDRLALESEDGPSGLDDAALAALGTSTFYRWPGNVRELRRVMFAAWFSAFLEDSDQIGLTHVTRHLSPTQQTDVVDGDLRRHVAQLVVSSAETALARHPDNKTAAARSLGFDRGQALERYLGLHRASLNPNE